MVITTHLKGSAKLKAEQWLNGLQLGDTIRIRKDLIKHSSYQWDDSDKYQFHCQNTSFVTEGEEYIVVGMDSDFSLHVKETNQTSPHYLWISWSMVDLTQFEKQVKPLPFLSVIVEEFNPHKNSNGTNTQVNTEAFTFLQQQTIEMERDHINLQKAKDCTFEYLLTLKQLGVKLNNIDEIELESKFGKIRFDI